MGGIRRITLGFIMLIGALGLWGQGNWDWGQGTGNGPPSTQNSQLKTQNLVPGLACPDVSGNRDQNSQLTTHLSFFPSPGYNFVYQPGMNGFGLGASYTYRELKAVDLIGGVEYRASDWGNQLLVSAGAGHTWWNNEHWAFDTQARIINGMALFRPASLYIFGGETIARLQYKIGRRIGISIHAGARWSTCPSYGLYGLITSYLEVPVGIGIIIVPGDE